MKRYYSDEEIKSVYYNFYVTGKSVPQIASITGISKPTLYRRFKKIGLKMRNDAEKSIKYQYNVDYFENIDTPNKAYWLGFIYADGFIASARRHNSMRVGIALSAGDTNHLYKFRNAISGEMPIKIYKSHSGYSAGSNYARIIVSGDKMARDLIKHGVFEHKTDIIQPPPISCSFYKDFIRGYFDGDGSIWKQPNDSHGTDIQYCVGFVGTDALLIFIQDVLLGEGIIHRRYSLNKRKKSQVVSNFKFGGNRKTLSFMEYLYDSDADYLQRKYEKYLELKSMLNSRLYQQ